MAPRDDTTPETRFDSFKIFRTSYKEVNNQGIDVAVFIPKNLKPGKHPILAKFHGGGLVRCMLYNPAFTCLRQGSHSLDHG
jgi:acetyl esterase/lipase